MSLVFGFFVVVVVDWEEVITVMHVHFRRSVSRRIREKKVEHSSLIKNDTFSTIDWWLRVA